MDGERGGGYKVGGGGEGRDSCSRDGEWVEQSYILVGGGGEGRDSCSRDGEWVEQSYILVGGAVVLQSAVRAFAI